MYIRKIIFSLDYFISTIFFFIFQNELSYFNSAGLKIYPAGWPVQGPYQYVPQSTIVELTPLHNGATPMALRALLSPFARPCSISEELFLELARTPGEREKGVVRLEVREASNTELWPLIFEFRKCEGLPLTREEAVPGEVSPWQFTQMEANLPTPPVRREMVHVILGTETACLIPRGMHVTRTHGR